MAQIASEVMVLESIHVSPPTGSVPTTSLPLVHLDLHWFYCHPIQRLFFYEFPLPTSHFMEFTLPTLKRSLSLTLQRFFPYAANIICPQPPGKPYIHYTEGDDFVDFTVAESKADFNHVIANYPRPIKLLHPFVPQLPPARLTEDGRIRVLPIIAFQITVFPNSGICIGSTYCHVVGDGKSFMHFMRSWTSIYRSGGGDLITSIEIPLPLINKDVIKDPDGVELLLLRKYWQWILSACSENSAPIPNQDVVTEDNVRATFVLGRAHAERLKQLVTAHCCRNNVDTQQIHISTFVVTCAFIWVCLIKSKMNATNNNLSHDDDDDDHDKLYGFLLSFDCRNRLEYPVPPTYFGNCIKPSIVDVKKSELIGENGTVLAAEAIGRKIKEMGRCDFRGIDQCVSSIIEGRKSGRLIPVAGSPKFNVYDTDFGWGRPCKVELTHNDYDGAIAMADCRDGQGVVEVGLALNKNEMDGFVTVFEQSLKLL